MTMSNHSKILAVGSAIVDILVHTDDDFINAHDLTKGNMKLLESADAMADLYATLGGGAEVSGGSAANTAAAIVSCGGEAGFIGKIADDDMGQVFTHDIKSVGVEYNPINAEGGRTATCIVLITDDAERTMIVHFDPVVSLMPCDISQARINAAEWVYLEGYFFDSPQGVDCCKHIAELAAQAQNTQIGGANAKTRLAFSLSDAGCVTRNRQAMATFLRDHVDLLIGNETEFEALLGQKGEAMITAARDLAPEVVITLGGNGSIILAGEDRVKIDACRAVNVVDTTGAGDLYAGGYLYARQNGASIEKAGQVGSIAAAEIISHLGARPERPLSTLIPSLCD